MFVGVEIFRLHSAELFLRLSHQEHSKEDLIPAEADRILSPDLPTARQQQTQQMQPAIQQRSEQKSHDSAAHLPVASPVVSVSVSASHTTTAEASAADGTISNDNVVDPPTRRMYVDINKLSPFLLLGERACLGVSVGFAMILTAVFVLAFYYSLADAVINLSGIGLQMLSAGSCVIIIRNSNSHLGTVTHHDVWCVCGVFSFPIRCFRSWCLRFSS